MKIKTDFVTNSSSSSFLIVGIDNHEIIDRLLLAEGFVNYNNTEFDGYDSDFGKCGDRHGKLISFYGRGQYTYWAGFDNFESMIETMTLPQIKVKFIEEVYDNFGILIDEDEVRLIHEETSS